MPQEQFNPFHGTVPQRGTKATWMSLVSVLADIQSCRSNPWCLWGGPWNLYLNQHWWLSVSMKLADNCSIYFLFAALYPYCRWSSFKSWQIGWTNEWSTEFQQPKRAYPNCHPNNELCIGRESLLNVRLPLQTLNSKGRAIYPAPHTCKNIYWVISDPAMIPWPRQFSSVLNLNCHRFSYISFLLEPAFLCKLANYIKTKNFNRNI